MLFAFICLDKPNVQQLRQAVREEHIEYMLAVKDRTVFGGPLTSDDGETAVGSIFAISFASRDDAEAFIAAEPYTRNDLFKSVTVMRWRQMVPEVTEGFLLEELARQKAISRQAKKTISS